MSTQLYIPNFQELKDMGFEQDQPEYLLMLNIPDLGWVYWNSSREQFYLRLRANSIKLYPRDKAHLEQIILAFSPPQ